MRLYRSTSEVTRHTTRVGGKRRCGVGVGGESRRTVGEREALAEMRTQCDRCCNVVLSVRSCCIELWFCCKCVRRLIKERLLGVSKRGGVEHTV